MIKIIICNVEPLVEIGICTIINQEKDLIFTGKAKNESGVQELNEKLRPDILILGTNSSNFVPPQLIDYMYEHCPKLKVLALAKYDESYLSMILGKRNLAGYALSSEEPSILVNAIREVAKGYTWYSHSVDKLVQQKVSNKSKTENSLLTNKEVQIVRLLSEGLSNTRIAAELNLGYQTVRNYISRIYSKLNINSRSEAILWAMKHSMHQ
jgi:NarL family two-component system response regulator LiaR